MIKKIEFKVRKSDVNLGELQEKFANIHFLEVSKRLDVNQYIGYNMEIETDDGEPEVFFFGNTKESETCITSTKIPYEYQLASVEIMKSFIKDLKIAAKKNPLFSDKTRIINMRIFVKEILKNKDYPQLAIND